MRLIAHRELHLIGIWRQFERGTCTPDNCGVAQSARAAQFHSTRRPVLEPHIEQTVGVDAPFGVVEVFDLGKIAQQVEESVQRVSAGVDENAAPGGSRRKKKSDATGQL